MFFFISALYSTYLFITEVEYIDTRDVASAWSSASASRSRYSCDLDALPELQALAVGVPGFDVFHLGDKQIPVGGE